jgi:lysophospholipase L1-like esterase
VFRHILAGASLMAAVAPAQAQQRYLALGDSYTIGEGVADSSRWPAQLARALRARGVAMADPEIVARTGWTTGELDAGITARLARDGLGGPYGLVTLLIGVNNQYRGLPVEAFRLELKALLQRAVGFAGGDAGRVIVVGIPDWGVTPFNASKARAQIAREIDAFNAVNRAEAEHAGAHWVEVTDLTRASPGDVVADGLHPSGAMYAKWVERIAPVAAKILGK